MIELIPLSPFAIGGRRECYIHPENPKLCIKVHRPEFMPAKLRREAPWWRALRKGDKDFDENFSDWKVLHDLEQAGDPAIWQHVPKLNGWVDTDRGRGLVIELLRDDDGLISRTLLDWIWQNGPSAVLDHAVAALASFWEARTIPSRSLGLHNIVMQEQVDDKRRLVVIDGLGNTQFLPFAKWSAEYARQRSASKVARLRRDIDELLERRKTNKAPGTRGFLLSRK